MKMVLRYAERGLGYCAWTPEDGNGLPSLWFGSLKELRNFADQLGYRLKHLC